MTETPSRAADAVSPGGGTSPVSTARRDAGAPTPARTPLKRRRMSRRARRDAFVFLAFAAPNPVLIAMSTRLGAAKARKTKASRSEEHTSELQSRGHLVCRLLLEKKTYMRSD